MIRFFIVVGAKSSETLVAKISFDRVHAADKNVEPAVKFLLVQDERVINISLN